MHKTVNVLDKVPLAEQATMKKDLREVYWAPNRASAEAAIDVFAEKCRAKYGRAVECLKDRDALLAFYDFPAEHWDHLRTSNPIESVFATVRRRTVRTKGFVVAENRQADGVQARHRRIEDLAGGSKAQISCRRSSRVSDSTTASRSSKCRPTTPPDHLVTQNPA
ncbi:hypothetical protein ACVIIV_003214 [Bradyrhizobium sp. USDA 4354]